uniref:Uncharacterized protein n=1 Tax=Acrobeloides nanus TaxID=290746 RepID=A0A914EBR4_9BILA
MSGSGDINRFERILIKIGGEPSWLRAKLSHFASVQSQEDLKSNGTNSTPNGKAFPENGKITSTLHPENPIQHPEEDARLLNCDTPMTERSSAPLIYAHSDHSDVLDEIELSDTKSH